MLLLRHKKHINHNNKLSKCPSAPLPPGDDALLRKFEKGFILDCIAVSNISNDFSKVNPKLGAVIPPYNAQNDIYAQSYFKFKGVKATLKHTKQSNGGNSIDGLTVDNFHFKGHKYIYLKQRNIFGAGHSKDVIDGHSRFLSDLKPLNGYNGLFGYRQNTPNLRMRPSLFEMIKY